MKRFVPRIAICLVLFLLLPAAMLPQSAEGSAGISLLPRSGAPGTKVTILGGSFTSYAGQMLGIFFNETRVASATVSSGAVFSASFEVPARASPGDATVSVRNVAGDEVASDAFVVPTPEIRLGTWGGTVGTSVTVTARGFHAGKPIAFRYVADGGIDLVAEQMAGETGDCSARLVVPASGIGKHFVLADNGQGQAASAEFEIIPSVTVEPPTVAVGDKVTVIATGFTADSEVDVGMYDRHVAYARSSERGSFIAQFIVPLMKAGRYELEIKDFSGVAKWAQIEIVSRLSLSKTAGEVGAKIDVTGTGFEVQRLVTITYDSRELGYSGTDDVGSFTATITIPIGLGGAHFVTATDGVNTRQVAYSVEKDPPSVPTPLSPKKMAASRLPLTLDWENLYDVSQPLVYTLQIGRSPVDLRPLLRREGLVASQYVLSEVDRLMPNRPGTCYYWSVRATDGAGNVGEWSEAQAFRIEPSFVLQWWARWVLIGFGVAVAVFFGFRIFKGARSAKS